MATYPANLQDAIQSEKRKPIWIAEILFNSGDHGTEGVNDIYIGTSDVTNIVSFTYPERYYPCLDIDSISGLSQKLDLLSGVSSIGSVSFRILDKDNWFSDVIKAADDVGQGLRRQLCEIYEIESGDTWPADRQKVRTMKITNAKQSSDGQWYTITAHDVQSDMQGDVFEPMLTTLNGAMLAADGSFTVTDSSDFELVTQPVYGSVGFMKIEDEIIRWSAKTSSHVITVDSRGMFGTTAADHADGSEVSEVIVLKGNPFAIALQVLTSTGTGTNGTYDVYPAHWGIGLSATSDVLVSDWETYGESIAGFTSSDATTGIQYEFKYNKSMGAKMFIESRILKQIGAFSFIDGEGRYGVRPYSDLANAAKENAARELNTTNIIELSEIDMDLQGIVNFMLIKYDEFPPFSGNYIRNAPFIDYVSISKHGKNKKPLVIKADGIDPTSVFVSQLYQRFHLVGAQLSTPPRKFSLTLMPSEAEVEIGEIVRITWPIRDAYTGNDLDIAAQVDSVAISPKTGEPKITVRAQHEKATFWQGGTGEVASLIISPTPLQIAPSGTHQLVARAFDQSGNQLPTPTIDWIASGDVTVNSSGVVAASASGSGSVYAVAGGVVSNTVSITIQALSGNPVASVVASPSAVSLQVGNTQQMSAEVLDASGDITNYTAINWNSDTPGVATVGLTTGIVTAVSNGTANITATETGSAISSAAVVCTVEDAVVPTYQPGTFADAVYQVGTQITTHGPVGGPHVIPDGYNFTAGSYWYDGDVSLPFGDTCTINGSVRIFSLGTITINGTIDGAARGDKLGGSGSTTNGANGGARGNTGKGGNGGKSAYGSSANFASVVFSASGNHKGGRGGAVNYPSGEQVSIIGTAESGGSFTAVSGIPSAPLCGSGGGGGGGATSPYTSTGGDGGESGAGLLLMARGIFCNIGQVDLRGEDGANATGAGYAGGGGGGGGGSFYALAERDSNGLPVISVDPARILTTGGSAGSAGTASFAGVTAATNGSTGGAGQKVIQVIG